MLEFLNILWPGVASSCIVALIGLLFRNVFYFRSNYSGNWEDEIFDEQDNIVKRDKFVLRHHFVNGTITGKVRRFYPEEQAYRKWMCSGTINGNHLILTFWPHDSTVKSDGCIYAVLQQDFTYSGYYLKVVDDKVVSVKINLRKTRRK